MQHLGKGKLSEKRSKCRDFEESSVGAEARVQPRSSWNRLVWWVCVRGNLNISKYSEKSGWAVVALHGGRVRRSNWWRKTLADPRGVVMEESKSHQAMKLEDTSDEEGTAQHAHHKGNFRGME